ncbi:hypothetical protein DFQ28_000698 [Apophysomyces sp. BC1034]|nr:hypothetical protein DFQ30_007849 [Apophysomyces sp. BC1015]KAG0181925.1 hypothetical protein DFQ29_006457 [Apophysomyces sp. BC1021]KAG0183869.1 hypothetical protein DFQ28_000698 [Apophysomyces sp. BC1034]
MTDAKYSFVVAMLNAGGLIGALSASYFNDRLGRRRTLLGTNVFMGLGSLVMTLASSPQWMMLGRFAVGLGGGVVTVVVPAYIAECVPKSSRGFFGTLNQLAIVIGILVAQVLGMRWSTVSSWRSILAVGVILSVIQLALLPLCVESPRYLASLPGGYQRARRSLLRLRGPPVELAEEEIREWRSDWSHDDVLEDDNRGTAAPASVAGVVVARPRIRILGFLFSPKFRRPLCLLLLLQLSQQFSGINAVIFYSTSIMSTVFPQSSDIITVYISVVNMFMTILSAYLMDRTGRRTLFLISASCMAVMSILLGLGIQMGQDRMAALSIIGFVAAFAVGLGPIPFLMIPELVETAAVSSAGSVGLAANMISNFIVSAGFLGLRDVIGHGQVFYMFGIILAFLTTIALRILPETKGRSAEEVVRSSWSIHSQSTAYQPIVNTENA